MGLAKKVPGLHKQLYSFVDFKTPIVFGVASITLYIAGKLGFESFDVNFPRPKPHLTTIRSREIPVSVHA